MKAYQRLDTDVTLRLVGHIDEAFSNIKGVEQIPFVPINELINQIFNARFCVLPLESFNYSYGQMTLMQQMALGKCVIAAKVPSLVDYIENGKTAVFYEAKDTEDLSKKMCLLLEDAGLCDRIASDGKQYLLWFCNEEVMASQIEVAYNTVINER